MSGKNQVPLVANWQSTNPQTTFLPLNNQTAGIGSIPSGQPNGAMAATNTIYSQIFDISRMDNIGLEVNYVGTATGTLTISVSNSGKNFYPLDPSPAITQPSGTSGGCAGNLNQVPFKYMLLTYVNTSGTGTLTVYIQEKDLN